MTDPKFINRKAVVRELENIAARRNELKKEQNALRVKAHRLRKLLEAAKAAT